MSDNDGRAWKHLGDVPYYMITFDKNGKCTSPAALDDLCRSARTKTDVFIFSHGWNNDWEAVIARYDRFIERFGAVQQRWWKNPTRLFAPVLVGVFWPSATLILPSERNPEIATSAADANDIDVLAEWFIPDQLARLNEIVARPSAEHLAELADIVAPVLSGIPDEEVGLDSEPVDPADLIAMWQEIGGPPVPRGRPGRYIDKPVGANDASPDPQAALVNPLAAIRDGIRATTVRLMKDRAGTVGGSGVAEMLQRVAEASTDARLSLVGHSYGCKVVLSAVCHATLGDRKVDSALLLQPAVSCYAFAEKVRGNRGGYREALNRVRLPILTTYSTHDAALRRFFHMALRRKADLAEAGAAATPKAPPSRFAALGGYGPWGSGIKVSWVDMPAAGFDFAADSTHSTDTADIVAADGSAYIRDHGAVETDETAWALLCQVKR